MLAICACIGFSLCALELFNFDMTAGLYYLYFSRFICNAWHKLPFPFVIARRVNQKALFSCNTCSSLTASERLFSQTMLMIIDLRQHPPLLLLHDHFLNNATYPCMRGETTSRSVIVCVDKNGGLLQITATDPHLQVQHTYKCMDSA